VRTVAQKTGARPRQRTAAECRAERDEERAAKDRAPRQGFQHGSEPSAETRRPLSGQSR